MAGAVDAGNGGSELVLLLANGERRGDVMTRTYAAHLAAARVNADPDLLPHHRLLIRHVFTPCDEPLAARAAIEFESSCSDSDESDSGAPQCGLAGLVGPSCSTDCQLVASLGRSFVIPQLSDSCTATSLGDSVLYPYFHRVVGNDAEQVDTLLAAARRFGWRRIALLHDTSPHGTSVARALAQRAADAAADAADAAAAAAAAGSGGGGDDDGDGGGDDDGDGGGDDDRGDCANNDCFTLAAATAIPACARHVGTENAPGAVSGAGSDACTFDETQVELALGALRPYATGTRVLLIAVEQGIDELLDNHLRRHLKLADPFTDTQLDANQDTHPDTYPNTFPGTDPYARPSSHASAPQLRLLGTEPMALATSHLAHGAIVSTLPEMGTFLLDQILSEYPAWAAANDAAVPVPFRPSQVDRFAGHTHDAVLIFAAALHASFEGGGGGEGGGGEGGGGGSGALDVEGSYGGVATESGSGSSGVRGVRGDTGAVVNGFAPSRANVSMALAAATLELAATGKVSFRSNGDRQESQWMLTQLLRGAASNSSGTGDEQVVMSPRVLGDWSARQGLQIMRDPIFAQGVDAAACFAVAPLRPPPPAVDNVTRTRALVHLARMPESTLRYAELEAFELRVTQLDSGVTRTLRSNATDSGDGDGDGGGDASHRSVELLGLHPNRAYEARLLISTCGGVSPPSPAVYFQTRALAGVDTAIACNSSHLRYTVSPTCDAAARTRAVTFEWHTIVAGAPGYCGGPGVDKTLPSQRTVECDRIRWDVPAVAALVVAGCVLLSLITLHSTLRLRCFARVRLIRALRPSDDVDVDGRASGLMRMLFLSASALLCTSPMYLSGDWSQAQCVLALPIYGLAAAAFLIAVFGKAAFMWIAVHKSILLRVNASLDHPSPTRHTNGGGSSAGAAGVPGGGTAATATAATTAATTATATAATAATATAARGAAGATGGEAEISEVSKRVVPVWAHVISLRSRSHTPSRRSEVWGFVASCSVTQLLLFCSWLLLRPQSLRRVGYTLSTALYEVNYSSASCVVESYVCVVLQVVVNGMIGMLGACLVYLASCDQSVAGALAASRPVHPSEPSRLSATGLSAPGSRASAALSVASTPRSVATPRLSRLGTAKLGAALTTTEGLIECQLSRMRHAQTRRFVLVLLALATGAVVLSVVAATSTRSKIDRYVAWNVATLYTVALVWAVDVLDTSHKTSKVRKLHQELTRRELIAHDLAELDAAFTLTDASETSELRRRAHAGRRGGGWREEQVRVALPAALAMTDSRAAGAGAGGGGGGRASGGASGALGPLSRHRGRPKRPGLTVRVPQADGASTVHTEKVARWAPETVSSVSVAAAESPDATAAPTMPHTSTPVAMSASTPSTLSAVATKSTPMVVPTVSGSPMKRVSAATRSDSPSKPSLCAELETELLRTHTRERLQSLAHSFVERRDRDVTAGGLALPPPLVARTATIFFDQIELENSDSEPRESATDSASVSRSSSARCAGSKVRLLLADVLSSVSPAEERAARLRTAASRIRDPKYSLKQYFDDIVAACPELRLYVLDTHSTGGRSAGDEYQRTIGAFFAIYWLMRLELHGVEGSHELDGQRGFCFGVDEKWAPPSKAKIADLARLTAPNSALFIQLSPLQRRLGFQRTADWRRLHALMLDAGLLVESSDIAGAVDVDVERTVAMLALTAVHDIFKLEALRPIVLPQHAPYCGYGANEAIGDHDVALGYILDHDKEALPSIAALPEPQLRSVRFTQSKIGFNHGWLVQAEAPPGALFSQFKRVLATDSVAPADIAFYFVHWLTDLAGAVPSPLLGAEKFVTKFPHAVLDAFLRSFSIVQRLPALSETELNNGFLREWWPQQALGPVPAELSSDESIALMRLVTQAQTEPYQRCVHAAFFAISDETRRILALELARTGVAGQAYSPNSAAAHDGPAFLLYYAPAFLRKSANSIEEASVAMSDIAAIFTSARQLWPLQHSVESEGTTVSIYLDELKTVPVGDVAAGYGTGLVWVLRRNSHRDGAVECVTLTALPALLARAQCSILRFWTPTNGATDLASPSRPPPRNEATNALLGQRPAAGA